jgi:outer membrane protein assembly factor BamB
VNPKTGDEVWSCAGLSNLVYTSPLVAKEEVVAMCGYGGPAIGVQRGGKGDVTESHRLWVTPSNPQRIGSGIVVGDYVYIVNENGVAWCLNPKTGERKWEKRLGGVNFWSSSCQAEGRIYVTNFDGDTFVLEADPSACKVLAENKIGEQTRGSLAFSGGLAFLRTHQNLYCFEAKK